MSNPLIASLEALGFKFNNTGKVSGAGLEVNKAEVVLPDGSKFYLTAYIPPTVRTVSPKEEAKRQVESKGKLTFDSSQRKVDPSDAIMKALANVMARLDGLEGAKPVPSK